MKANNTESDDELKKLKSREIQERSKQILELTADISDRKEPSEIPEVEDISSEEEQKKDIEPPPISEPKPEQTGTIRGLPAVDSTDESPSNAVDLKKEEIEGQGSNKEISMATAVSPSDLEQEVRDQVKREAVPATVVVHEVGKSWFNLILAIGCCIVVVIAAITAGVVVALKNNSIVASGNCSFDDDLDSIEHLKQNLYPLLNQEDSSTIQEIEKEGTPQSKAFTHLSNDPNMKCYTTDRLLQRFALTTFYFSTNGDWWYENTDWLNYEKHECDWFRKKFEVPQFLACDDFRVYRKLVINQNNVTGEIPLEVRYLVKLEVLDLYSNAIESANLEATINNMQQLLVLHLYDNKLKLNMDELPASFLPDRRLETLQLGQNFLFGNYPESFGSLTKLKSLILELNKDLVGFIPESYCDLQNFEAFTVWATGVNGTMPQCLCDLVGDEVNLWIEAQCVKDVFSCDCCQESPGCNE